jgi:hypothetical protein
MIRLVQISNRNSRRVALVEEPSLRCLTGVQSVYELVRQCLLHGDTLSMQVLALARYCSMTQSMTARPTGTCCRLSMCQRRHLD